jgi:hypothetical protein
MKHTAILFINRLIHFSCLSLLLTPSLLFGQNTQELAIALMPELWQFQPQKVEFMQHKGVAAMKILSDAGFVVFKDFIFSDFTLEFDTELTDPRFASVYFRWNGSKMNECFYFRTARAGNLEAGDAVQYAPLLEGINLWDLLPHFQAKADFERDAWTHVKLVVSGAQMRAYVNQKLVLEVPRLEGETTKGNIAFSGQAIIANVTVKPKEVEDLSPQVGADPTDSDPHYIRNWQLSAAFHTPKNVDFSYDFFPTDKTSRISITAERRGLINLTRPFGQSDTRRFAWLKTTIQSTATQKRTLALGFSDEVWVFINGFLLYADKNLYGQPITKQPDGRCSLENTSFVLPLVAGINELLIGVANDFYGWGIIARLDSIEGLTLEK